jgi:hypothetical protein
VVSPSRWDRVCSCEIEGPPAEAWWCPHRAGIGFVVVKLKDHRLKPGGVPVGLESGL